MKIGFNPGSIVDLNGSPLVGRVTIYEHDSEIVKTVYTLEGETYTQAENPQLLNVAGRLDDTLYFDASVVDVKIERYVGEEGLMSEESPDDDFETFDVYSYGFTLDIGTAGEIVDTVDDLRTTPTSAGTVNVRGYYYAGDCSPRLYVWDASSSATEDGGYIIASSLTAEGRWILAYDGETIPCTWYGVRPNNLSNIASLLGYPGIIGTYSIRTAPRVYFVRGTYDAAAYTYTTDKALVFSSKAKFTGATFKCPSVEVDGAITDYIADFNFNDNGLEARAHSSWFRSSYKFWKCGACELVYDENNYFANTTPAADEMDAAATFIINDFGRHVFTRKLKIGVLTFNYDNDDNEVNVFFGTTLVCTFSADDLVNMPTATISALYSGSVTSDTVATTDITSDRYKVATDSDYWTSTDSDIDLSSVHATEGEIYLLTNTKEGQINVTVRRTTGTQDDFHVHFPMNSGNSVALVCVQSWQAPSAMFPTGRLAWWSPITANVVLTKTTD